MLLIHSRFLELHAKLNGWCYIRELVLTFSIIKMITETRSKFIKWLKYRLEKLARKGKYIIHIYIKFIINLRKYPSEGLIWPHWAYISCCESQCVRVRARVRSLNGILNNTRAAFECARDYIRENRDNINTLFIIRWNAVRQPVRETGRGWTFALYKLR